MSFNLDSIKSDSIKECLINTREAVVTKHADIRAVSLTMAALIRFSRVNANKEAPEIDSPLKESIVKTGAYYFGPLFVLNKGTSIPSSEILKELARRGFYTDSLKTLNNAQINLFFITLKSLGLVSDKHLLSYVKYGV